MSSTEPAVEKHHSQEADELDFLCRKLSDVRVKNKYQSEDDVRLNDLSIEQYQQLVTDIYSSEFSVIRKAIVKFRKILAHDDIQPYLDRILASGVLPQFIKLIQDAYNPEFQFESAWILTNIAAGTSTHTAHVAEAIPALVSLLRESQYKEIREQCVWCLGNIAGDCSDLRAKVLDSGALQPLLSLIEDELKDFLKSEAYFAEIPTHFLTSPSSSKKKNHNISTLRIALWALSNFCRGSGQSQLDEALIEIALPVLSTVITCCAPSSAHSDDEVLMDSCWAMSRTLRGINEFKDSIYVSQEVCSRLGSLIMHKNPDVQIPALRCLINIVSGCDNQTQQVINAGVIPCLHYLLKNSTSDMIRKEACLIISNITAGTVEQVQACIEDGIFPTLVHILCTSDFKTKREACWAISNALLNKDSKQVEWFLNQENVLPPLFNLISNSSLDERITLKTMEALKNVLIVGDTLITNSSDEESVLKKFNGMKIGEPDSTYSSMVELSEGKNPFLFHFMKPIEIVESKNERLANGVEILKCFRQFLTKSQNENPILVELRRLSNEILDRWFSDSA